MSSLCKTCGEEDCDKHTFFLGKTVKLEHFSGSTPPEIFVGKWYYPDVYTGILAPQEIGDTTIMSSPEEWHKNKLAISDIMGYRNQLIYGRTQSNIKKLETKFLMFLFLPMLLSGFPENLKKILRKLLIFVKKPSFLKPTSLFIPIAP